MVLLGTVVAGAVVLLALRLGPPSEPVYQGKPARQWLQQWSETFASPDGAREAIAAFKAMGEPGASFLVRVLKDRPGNFAPRLENLAARIGLGRWAERRLEQRRAMEARRYAAAKLIGQMGPAAHGAIPVLERLYRDRTESQSVGLSCGESLAALGPIGVEFLPNLVANLSDTNAVGRPWSAKVIGHLGPPARSAIPVLAASLQEPWLAWYAGEALWRIDGRTDAALTALAAGLTNRDAASRWLAFQRLATLGPAARTVLPTVLQALRDSDREVREAAADALGRISPERKVEAFRELNREALAALPAILQALRDVTNTHEALPGAVRTLHALAALGPAAAAAVPTLVWFVTERPPTPAPSAAVEAFLSSGESLWRSEAWAALGEIGVSTPEAVRALAASAVIPQSGDSRSACLALARLGPAARLAVPALQTAMRTENPNLQLHAAYALPTVAPDQAEAAVPILERLARVDAFAVHSRARIALWKLKRWPECPVLELRQHLDTREREQAIELLGDLGPEARVALPALIQALQAPYTSQREGIAYAIRRIDPAEFERLGLPGTLALP